MNGVINTRVLSTQTSYALGWKLVCTSSTGRRLLMSSMSLGLKLIADFMERGKVSSICHDSLVKLWCVIPSPPKGSLEASLYKLIQDT